MLIPSPYPDNSESKRREVASSPLLARRIDSDTEQEAVHEQSLDPRLIHSIAVAKQFGRKTAHDFNNVLAVIHGFTGILQNRLRQDEANLEIVQQIEASALEALRLTNWLSSFANNRSAQLALLDLNRVVEEWATGIWEEKPANIDLEMDFSPDSLLMLGDEAQLEELCRELWLNAVEAMPQGGRVRWQTTVEMLPMPSQTGAEESGSIPMLRLRVSDTGVGMDTKTQESIFEPFFTKKSGKGRGLGLSTVYDTVYAHQGYIRVSSAPGEGTAVDVYFPAQVSESRGQQQLPSSQPNPEPTVGKVLMIDDEAMILEMVGQMLQGLGCEVIGVANGEAALDLYQQSGHEISVVLLDMTLPGISGLETFQRLKELDPDSRIIVSTGDSHQQAVHDAVDQGAFGVLSKPFLAGHLTDVVTRALS